MPTTLNRPQPATAPGARPDGPSKGHDPAATTLELDYLRPVLDALPEGWGSAVDVGAHRGDMTAALADMGFRVLAVEPQPGLADRLERRFGNGPNPGRVRVARCGASDRAGTASLLVGSASTVCSLERAWTTVAFPEEFKAVREVAVPVRPLAELLVETGFSRPAFVKVDVEGHELPALRGLLEGCAAAGDAPPVVMFEANQRFPGAARACVAYLRARGYVKFDLFVREGAAPLAAESFNGPDLPPAWRAYGDKYFYANVIAYHGSAAGGAAAEAAESLDPQRPVRQYHLAQARGVLRRALELEAAYPVAVHPLWEAARRELREYLLDDGNDWQEFLRHPVCRNMFVRGRWGPAQDHELVSLRRSAFGRELLSGSSDPDVGSPDRVPLPADLSGEVAPATSVSTNMLGMLYYLERLHAYAGGELPARVVEMGGGYGAFAWAYSRHAPGASYVIVDLPEMLALQHYFLSLALPEHRVVFSATGGAEAQPGQITLMPVSLLRDAPPGADLFFSTFAYSEMPEQLQRRVADGGFCGARRLFLAGQLGAEAPEAGWVGHGEVIGGVVGRFTDVRVQRFHIGNNYLLTASR